MSAVTATVILMSLATAADVAFAQLVLDQDGVLSVHQLAICGIDRHQIRRNIGVGRWQRAGRAVVVLHNGPLTERQRRWVAVLSQSGRGALAGVTAATEQGLLWRGDEPVHVLVDTHAHPAQMDGVRVHVSRRFSTRDLHPARTLPTVRLERGVVDAAAWFPQPRVACGVLARAVQQRLTTPDRLRQELTAAGAVRHTALLRAILGDIDGGAQSFAEIDVGRLVRRAGLPPPRRQVRRTDRQGHQRYLDVDLDGFLLEIDGGVHLLPLSYWDDMERQNDLVIVTGQPILRVPTVALRIDEAKVVQQLAAAAHRFCR